MADYKLPADVVALINSMQQRIATLERVLTGPRARGTATVAFPNSQQATAVTVTHGLGTTPQDVFLTPQLGSFNASLDFYASSFTATQFTINAFCSIVLNGNTFVSWLAIG